MTMAYFASFDRRLLPTGNISVTKSGGGTIAVSPSALAFINAYGNVAFYYNYIVTNNWSGMDYGHSNQLKTFSQYTFYQAIAVTLRAAADVAGWSDPDSINVGFNSVTRRVTLEYPTGITAITFSNATIRRLFGFAANFSGSDDSIAGTQIPSHIIEPTIDGASSASTVYETDAISTVAFSATGRSYSIARTQAPLRRKWVQQYETRAKTFRRYAGAEPAEYTFEDLYKDCRSSLPFAVMDGFLDGALTAYCFENGSENFHAMTAVAGSRDQFHVPFETVAVGRVEGVTIDGDSLTFEGEGLIV